MYTSINGITRYTLKWFDNSLHMFFLLELIVLYVIFGLLTIKIGLLWIAILQNYETWNLSKATFKLFIYPHILVLTITVETALTIVV